MSGLVQPGYAPPAGPEPSPSGRPARWLVIATVVWAVVLAALTWYSVRTDPPTVREQRTLSDAGPVVDGAIGQLSGALGGDAVPALTPPRVDRGCRVTPLADGAVLRRGITVVVPAGAERALLERVSERLPDHWRPGVRVTSTGPRLRADAGEFVLVEGRVEEEGRVTFTADTGCRPVGDDYVRPAIGAGAGPDVDALTAALRALGRPDQPVGDHDQAACPGGGTVRTVRAEAVPAPPDPVAALAPLANGAPVVATGTVYAYRAGPVGVVAELTGDGVRLTATTGCAG
ncbi:hypothetical protein [Micromonospora endolithica]|uniref:Uncharacterized protein n=1 Tax=Micromonospora endolithica TaxID=230091 RepID=A0A3A9YSX4_9ACTN|nr:hypothetical protein [Micromonospora endolithica]RKN39103.1 hypothetical protein D7223_29555 [Micromonospora endolithica]TWJ25604.1 hypothetical protein JD76_05777 [Micromonospora endolithica]